MIPNIYIENGSFTKHPFKTGGLGFQVRMQNSKLSPMELVNPIGFFHRLNLRVGLVKEGPKRSWLVGGFKPMKNVWNHLREYPSSQLFPWVLSIPDVLRQDAMVFSVCAMDIKGFIHELNDQKRSGCSNSWIDRLDRFLSSKSKNTLPKFNIAPEKWWLEDYFPFGMVYFQGLC